MCTKENLLGLNTALDRALDITLGCSLAEGWLHLADIHMWLA